MSLGVGVVVPARNAEKTLALTIRSLINCRGIDQIVIVDDQSTDKTKEIAISFPDDRLEVISGPGQGISKALNAGFDRLNTRYAMRCDADDKVPADRLEWQLPYLLENADLVAVSAGFETMLENGIMCGTLACQGEPRDVTEILKSGTPVTSFCTWLTRTHVIRKIGGARSWFRTAEDVDLMFRLASEGSVLHVPRVAYHYLMHDESINHSTSDSTRYFFDQHAAKFIQDRCINGSDALDRKEDLPAWPSVAQGEIRTALQRGIGHAIATAWAEADRGDYAKALKRLSRMRRKAPFERKLIVAYLKIMLIRLRKK